MADDCTIDAICSDFEGRLGVVTAAAQAQAATADARLTAIAAQAAPLLALVNRAAGGWVASGCGDLPSLGELLGRINNVGAGLSVWRFREYETGAARATLALPASITGPLRVTLNAVQLGPADYLIAGASLTLSYPLEVGDELLVTTYGDAP